LRDKDEVGGEGEAELVDVEEAEEVEEAADGVVGVVIDKIK
ncbi:4640_t:CDS:1, partial [Acaulospora morrowiae]